jgi:hypothetical protein
MTDDVTEKLSADVLYGTPEEQIEAIGKIADARLEARLAQRVENAEINRGRKFLG